MDFDLGSTPGATARFGRNNLPDLDLKPNNYASTMYFWARATVPGKYNVILRVDTATRRDKDIIGEFTINAANTWEHSGISNPAAVFKTKKTSSCDEVFLVLLLSRAGFAFQPSASMLRASRPPTPLNRRP